MRLALSIVKYRSYLLCLTIFTVRMAAISLDFMRSMGGNDMAGVVYVFKGIVAMAAL